MLLPGSDRQSLGSKKFRRSGFWGGLEWYIHFRLLMSECSGKALIILRTCCNTHRISLLRDAFLDECRKSRFIGFMLRRAWRTSKAVDNCLRNAMEHGVFVPKPEYLKVLDEMLRQLPSLARKMLWFEASPLPRLSMRLPDDNAKVSYTSSFMSVFFLL